MCITLIQNILYQVSTTVWVKSYLDVSEKGEKGGYIPYQVRLVTYLQCSVQWEWLMMISRYCELSRVNKPTTVWCYERKDIRVQKFFEVEFYDFMNIEDFLYWKYVDLWIKKYIVKSRDKKEIYLLLITLLIKLPP